MNNNLSDITQNVKKLSEKQLGEHILQFTGMEYEVSKIQFNQTTGYDFDLKEFTILVQHNLPQLGYAGTHYLVLSATAHPTGYSNKVTLSFFPITNSDKGIDTCVTQVKLCGNLMTQCFQGMPRKLIPTRILYGGWVNPNQRPCVIPDGLEFSEMTSNNANKLAVNRLQTLDTVKGLQICIQTIDGTIVNIPSDAYIFIDIYGIRK